MFLLRNQMTVTGAPVYVTTCFSLAALRILFLSLSLVILMMMCLGVGLFRSNLFETLYASWTCVSFSFTRVGKFQSLFLQIDYRSLARSLLLLVFSRCRCCSTSCCPKRFLSSLHCFNSFYIFAALPVFSTLSSKSLI